MASHYTHVPPISTDPQTLFTRVRWWIALLYSYVYRYAYVTTFHLSTQIPPHTLLYLSIPIEGGWLFLYITICNNTSLMEWRSGYSHTWSKTSEIQSIILENQVTYNDVPTHHPAVYHARVLDLPFRYISNLHQWPTTNTCHVQPDHVRYIYL